MKWLTAILIIVFVALGCKQKNNAISTDTISEKDSAIIINYIAGKKLFESNCSVCHPLNKHVNPQILIGIEDRWKDKDLLYEFIRNSQAVIAKDAYAKIMYKEYNKTAMPSFPNLTDKQIEQMLLYVKITLR
ncbi:c-type cytochrome [Parasediminibacterium paludis]|uniref:C-type cytochrome n=1 Tax=Parasediminibacterium paludis TaxID=908966 RepID=A0ABV8Q0T7_9BACT